MVLAAFTWQTGLSLGALVVAGISLVAAGISLVYARHADARAGRAEQRALRGHPRVVRESGREQPIDGPRSGQVVYEYEVHNDGYAVVGGKTRYVCQFDGHCVNK